MQEKVEPQVFADASLGHTFHESYAYKDLEANREVWAMRAALGDPACGVPGIIELLTGTAGARKRWDDTALRSALSQIAAADDIRADAKRALADAERRIVRATRQLDQKPRVTTEVETQDSTRALVLVQQRLADMTTRDGLRDIREAAREARREAEQRIATADKLTGDAQSQLHLIKTRGRTVLIDDLAPLPGEVPLSELPEAETFQDAVERIKSLIGTVDVLTSSPADGGEALLRVRIHLNLEEFATVHGIHARTLRRWVDGTRSGPLTSGVLRQASVLLGSRRHFLRVTRLPESWWSALTQAQHELLEQLLRVPMGATQFGGAVEDEQALLAVAI